MTEIEARADEIRLAAKSCGCVLDLAQALNWPISSAGLANEQLGLGLPWQRPNRKPGPAVNRERPKPVSKKGGGK